jgi:Protein of unknown function (DUF2946)
VFRARSKFRQLIAGVVTFAVMFQVLLVALQLSLFAAAIAEAAVNNDFLQTICSEHNEAVPEKDRSANHQNCILCPFCSCGGFGPWVISPEDLRVAPVQQSSAIDINFNVSNSDPQFIIWSRSRGPPAATNFF